MVLTYYNRSTFPNEKPVVGLLWEFLRIHACYIYPHLSWKSTKMLVYMPYIDPMRMLCLYFQHWQGPNYTGWEVNVWVHTFHEARFIWKCVKPRWHRCNLQNRSYKVGPLPVASRIITPLKGVMTPVWNRGLEKHGQRYYVLPIFPCTACHQPFTLKPNYMGDCFSQTISIGW